MNIRQLNHLYRQLTALKAWHLLVPLIIFSLLAVYGLRSNYSRMVELRQEVYAADKENRDVEKALQDLRAHVHGHMNTNLTSGSNSISQPIQLQARYERLVSAEKENIKAKNAQVTAQAEQTCAAQFPAAGFNAPRVECIQNYVGANAAKSGQIPDGLYKFNFVSPVWSPDLAGYSIVFAVFFLILFIARAVLMRWMHHRLN